MTQDTKKKQIYDLLKERIESGYYPPGCRLPKEVDLAAELKVSRVTLRPALYLLEMEKLIRRITRIGTFVRDLQAAKNRILVLFSPQPDLSERANNPYLYILPCLQSAADRMNVQLDFCEDNLLLSPSAADCGPQLRTPAVEGIFWLANHFIGTEPLLKTLRATGLPVLLPHGTPFDAEITGFTVLGTNYRELTRDGLKYLAAQGHRRVGYIGGEEMHYIAPADYLGYVKEAGLDPDPALLRIIEWRKGKQIVFDAVEQLMKMTNRPTAIFSYSDYLSLQIYEYLHREKIRIPDDVCVLTTGGQIGCDFLNPPLSALEYGNQTIADMAMETMLKMIHDKCRMGHIVTPHCLKARESTKKVILHHSKPKSKKEKQK